MQTHTEDRPERLADLDWINNPSAPLAQEELLQFIHDEVTEITAILTGKEERPC